MKMTSKDFGIAGSTLLFALLLLFFFQLLGMWIESIYRIGLIKVSPGMELSGLLLILISLLILVANEKHERSFLWAVTILFIACRLVCPLLDASVQIIVGGVGVSMFLIILAYALSARFSFLKGDIGQAVGIAVLSSMALRNWGSSADVSVDGLPIIIGGILALLVVVQFRAVMVSKVNALPEPTQPSLCRIPAMLGLFANFTLVYLVFSCPAVVCTWNGYAHLDWSGAITTGAVIVSFTSVLLMTQRQIVPRPFLTALWNLLLISLLIGVLLLWRPKFPETAQSPALFIDGVLPHANVLLYIMLLLSGIVVINVQHITGFTLGARPRNAIFPVLMGMALLLTLSLLLIASNTWGYVPYGHLFRNQFYLPFLIAGVGIVLPWMLLKRTTPVREATRDHVSGIVVILLALVAITGVLAHYLHAPATKPESEITVMTYNMQLGSHKYGNRNYSQQRDLLRQINPDIIGLQECDAARPSGGNMDAVRYLAESLGYYACYGPGAISGTFGSAILSRYPIKNPHVFFTYSDTDEVGTVVGEIDVNGTTIAFFSNHPAGSADVMNAHVDALIGEARKYVHVIAVGDYNFTSQEPYYDKLSRVLQNSAAALGTENNDFHGGRHNLDLEIDHIFTSPDFQVLESHYLPPSDSQTDHPAHWSVLRLK